jgi:hypothetical protein
MNKVVALSVLGVISVFVVSMMLIMSDPAPILETVVSGSSTNEVENNPAKTSGTASLQTLLAKAEDLECTISRPGLDAAAEATTGTYFTSQGRMRGDFLVSGTPDGSISSVIMRDGFLYSWSIIAGEAYGVKIDLAATAEIRTTGSALATQEPVPLDEPVTYTCVPWSPVDGSIFEPPTDILFRDFSEVMNVGMEFGTSYEEPMTNEAQCALCAQVTAGPGRDECLLAFSCKL